MKTLNYLPGIRYAREHIVIEGVELGVQRDGRIWNIKNNREYKPYKANTGYMLFWIYPSYSRIYTNNNNDPKMKGLTFHSVVISTFKKKPKGNLQYEINHINGDKTDNRIENLEWVTHHQNMIHAYKTGLHKPSGIEGMKIKCLNNNIIYKSQNEASRSLNINCGEICKQLKGQRAYCKGYNFEIVKR